MYQNITDLDFVGADVEHADHAADEVADGFEVHAADAPGAVDQQHDVGLGCGLTLELCGEMAGGAGGEAVRKRTGAHPRKNKRGRSLQVETCWKKVRGGFTEKMRAEEQRKLSQHNHKRFIQQHVLQQDRYTTAPVHTANTLCNSCHVGIDGSPPSYILRRRSSLSGVGLHRSVRYGTS